MFHCYHYRKEDDRVEIIPGRATMVSLISTRSNYSSILTIGAPTIIDLDVTNVTNRNNSKTNINNQQLQQNLVECHRIPRSVTIKCDDINSMVKSNVENLNYKNFDLVGLGKSSILSGQLMNCDDLLRMTPSNRYGLLRNGKLEILENNESALEATATQMETIYFQPDDSHAGGVKDKDAKTLGVGNEMRKRNQNEELKTSKQKLSELYVSEMVVTGNTISTTRCSHTKYDCLRSGYYDGSHFVHFMPDAVQLVPLECRDKVYELSVDDVDVKSKKCNSKGSEGMGFIQNGNVDTNETNEQMKWLGINASQCKQKQKVNNSQNKNPDQEYEAKKKQNVKFNKRNYFEVIKNEIGDLIRNSKNQSNCFNCFGCMLSKNDELEQIDGNLFDIHSQTINCQQRY